MNENKNIKAFSEELSEIIGWHVGLDHIHPAQETDSRHYYIQGPIAGAPLLLVHYRGPLFVDINVADYQKMESGEISAHDYINSANWQIGYYWGGGSMIGGGYYQPFDIVGRPDEAKRYFQILSCRTFRRSSGHLADENRCTTCSVENCPFSRYKTGSWDNELKEYDPRVDFLTAVARRFEGTYPEYKIRGIYTTSKYMDHVISLVPNGRHQENELPSFSVYASENVVRNLLMRTVTPENWDVYVSEFSFQLMIPGMLRNTEYFDVTEETLKTVSDKFDYVAMRKQKSTELTVAESSDTIQSSIPVVDDDADNIPCVEEPEELSFFEKLKNFFINLF